MDPPAGSKGAKQSVGPMGGGPEALRIKLLGGFSVSVGFRTIQQNEWRLKNPDTRRWVARRSWRGPTRKASPHLWG